MSKNQMDSAALTMLDKARAAQWEALEATTKRILDRAADYAVELADARKKKTRAQRAKGSIHGKSIKNPATYEALRGKLGKSSAAAISNAALNKGYRKGSHRGK